MWEGPQTVLNELFQIRSCSSFTSQPSFLKRFVSLYCWFQVSQLRCFRLSCWRKLQMYTLSCVTTAQPLARAPYVVLFDLKLLNEDGNWQVCMHARKGVSEASRIHFRACKISKFSGGCPQTPLRQSIAWPPLFVFALAPHNPLGGPAQNSCEWVTAKWIR